MSKFIVATIKEYDLVRIVQLHHPAAHYDGWSLNRRPPQMGDIGTVVDILHAPDWPVNYIVEASDAEGITIWLGDFSAEEIEPVTMVTENPAQAQPQTS